MTTSTLQAAHPFESAQAAMAFITAGRVQDQIAERVRELYDYSVVTGCLYTKTGIEIPCRRIYNLNGTPRYEQIRIDGVRYLLHRVIFLWVEGRWPNRVDHENLDCWCNAWHNIRESTASTNGCNRTKQKNNISGHKGVFFDKERGCWKAKIQFEGKGYELGRFFSREAAKLAYDTKAAELHGDFARNDTGKIVK